ncbi:MAG: hypothetical protein PGN07_09885 [Aeromicrobium erythreum]
MTCFWVETGRPTLAARLVFRHGYADETLPRHGWTHLLEHLALHGQQRGTLMVNGSVGPLLTEFLSHGPHDLVVDHLSTLTQRLRQLDGSRLAAERKVLGAESDQQNRALATALSMRYGARGPGVANYPNFGLEAATAEGLHQLSRTVFTRENAALVLDGPPPSGLRLDLPSGSLLQPMPVEPIESRFPAAYVEPGGLLLSGTVPRSPSTHLVADALQALLVRELRDRAAGAYSPFATYEHVDAETSILVAGSDTTPELREVVVDLLVTLLQDLRTSGMPAELVEDARANLLASAADPYNAFGIASSLAYRHLRGLDEVSADDVVDEIVRTGDDEVSRTVMAFHGTLLLGVEPDTTWNNQFRMIRQEIRPPLASGRRLRHRDWPADRTTLRWDEECIQVSHPRDGGYIIPFSEVEGVMTHTDGRRAVVDRQGWGRWIDPAAWHRGHDAVAALDERVPAERTVPALGVETPRPFARLSAPVRWTTAVRSLYARSAVFSTVVITAVLAAWFVLVVLRVPDGTQGAAALTVWPLAAYLFWFSRKHVAPRSTE